MAKSENSQLGFRFKQALTSVDFGLIAEIKKRSPSAGDLAIDVNVPKLARQYLKGGATCLSVLTNQEYFSGSLDDLRLAKQATNLPVMRKDFITSFAEIELSFKFKADAILLIVADIDPTELKPFHLFAAKLGLDVVTEVRNQTEFKRAVEIGASIIAINQRDNPKANQFRVDFTKAVRLSHLLSGLDGNVVTIAASGIGSPEGTNIADLVVAGYDGALIGQELMISPDPTLRLEEFQNEIKQSQTSKSSAE